MSDGRTSRIALILVLTAAALFYIVVAIHEQAIEGDSAALVRGTRGLWTCLSAGDIRACPENTAAFPVFQYLITVPVIALGGSDDLALRALSSASALSLPLLVAAGWWAGGSLDDKRWRAGLAVILAASPLLAYGPSTFRTAPAALAVVLALGAVLRDARPTVVVATVVLAGLHQDLAIIFLGALLLICARRGEALIPTWRRTRPIILGAAITVVLTVASNQMRFGTNRNPYTDPMWRTPTRWIDEMFASLVASPNGGVAVFWPLAAIVIGAVGVKAIFGLTWHRKQPVSWLPATALLAVVAAHTLFLSIWWSPFGWHAWGPRLSLPFTAGFVVTAAHVVGRDAGRWFDLLGDHRLVRGAVGLAISAVAVPHLLFAFLENKGIYQRTFFQQGDAACPQGTGNHISGTATVEYFYDCQMWHRAWHRRPLVLVDMVTSNDWSPIRLLFVLALAGTILALMASGLRVPRVDGCGQRAAATTREPELIR